MAYPGLTLFIAAVVGIGFAAYQFYTLYSTLQHEEEERRHTYTYIPPALPPTSHSSSASAYRRRRRRSCSSASSACDKCCICLEGINGQFRMLGCQHSFHKLCIESWLRESRQCPICRAAA